MNKQLNELTMMAKQHRDRYHNNNIIVIISWQYAVIIRFDLIVITSSILLYEEHVEVYILSFPNIISFESPRDQIP